MRIALIFCLVGVLFVSFGGCENGDTFELVKEEADVHLFVARSDGEPSMDEVLKTIDKKLHWDPEDDDDDDDDGDDDDGDDDDWSPHDWDPVDHSNDDNYDDFTNTPGGVPFKWPKHPGTGNLTDFDNIFLDRVRLAGLWEIPAGLMAMTKGTTHRVQKVGRLLAYDHSVLDNSDRQVAEFLGRALPNEPNADQQGWLNEMKAATGEEFNRVFADRLRLAHGAVYQAIALARANSRNNVIRPFAKYCEGFVSRHMLLLETTGYVDYTKLPPL
jgi:predicted outer membrane protein